jgi:hypothetical protein
MKDVVALGMFPLKHRAKRIHRRHVQGDPSFSAALRLETWLLLIANVQHARASVNVRELEKKHLFAPKSGVRVQHDELRPVIEVQRMRSIAKYRSNPADQCSRNFACSQCCEQDHK